MTIFEEKIVYRKQCKRGLMVGIEWLRQVLEMSKLTQKILLYLLEVKAYNEVDSKRRIDVANALNIDMRNMPTDFRMLEGLGFLKSVKKMNPETQRKVTFYYLDPASLMPVADPGYVSLTTNKVSRGNVGERYEEPTVDYETYKKIDPDFAIHHRTKDGRLLDA